MQSPWYRAVEAHICSSRPCTTASHRAIIRRIPIRGRQRRQSGPFAAFSTTTTNTTTTDLDAFAVLDGSHDNGSHSTLAAKTEKTRTRRTQPKKGPTISRQYVDFGRMRPRTPMGAIEALNSICDTEEALIRHQARRRSYNKFLRGIHRSYDLQGQLSSGFVDHLGPNLVAMQLAVDLEQRQDDRMEGREPITSIQFEKFHYMINKMVDHLISESYHVEFPNDPERARRNLESLDSAWTAIRMLRSEGYPRYNHPSVDPLATKEARDRLADKIRGIFEVWGTDRAAKPKFQVAKLCYNLLVSPVPPSMHHYNLLIVGFLRKAHYSLGDIVIESFLEDSRLRPTPQTHVCLLAHYRKKRDIKGFYHIIRRMMALDNRGILLRRRWFEDVAKIPALHRWARQPEVTTSLQANWVIERPSRGQDVYEALVSGLLGFGRVKDAVKVFIGSLQEKMGVSVELFTYMLKQCLYTLDASTAAMLSRGLTDNVDLVVALLLRDNCPQRLTEHLLPVLNMDEPPSWPMSEERAKMIWTATTLATDPQDRGSVRRIKTAMFIRHTETYLTRLEKRLRPIHHISRLDSPVERTVIANYCAVGLTQLHERQGKFSGTILKHQTLQTTVRMLEQLTWDLGSPERLARSHKQVLGVLGDKIPRPVGASLDAQTARLEELTTIANDWFHYRISKTRGIISDTRRLLLYAELKMLIGRRLVLDTLRLLRVPVALGWRSLDLSAPETQAAEAEGREPQREAAGDQETPAKEGSLTAGYGLLDELRKAKPASTAWRRGFAISSGIH